MSSVAPDRSPARACPGPPAAAVRYLRLLHAWCGVLALAALGSKPDSLLPKAPRCSCAGCAAATPPALVPAHQSVDAADEMLASRRRAETQLEPVHAAVLRG